MNSFDRIEAIFNRCGVFAIVLGENESQAKFESRISDFEIFA